MARLKDKVKALELRAQGKSYNQIRVMLGVTKSTLSYWLHNYPLSKEQIYLLSHNQQRIERYRETRQRKKQERLDTTYNEQLRKIFPLSKRDLFIAGLFLFWGEGSKTRLPEIEITNTDPAVIRFYIYWITKYLELPREKIKLHLHLYNDMQIEKEIVFWSEQLNLPKEQFIKPYIKPNSSQHINRGTFGHGTCSARMGNARIAEGVHMGLKAIRDKFGP